MEHMLLKVAATATDEGVFEAVISTASVDREKDIVSPAGMVRALQKWASTGKKIPLAWNHSGAADQQVGYIDPASAKQVGREVVANGFVDQSIDTGQHVWRLAKAGTLGFSFGYLILKGSKRKGGGRNIDELDVFEVTATTTPMNNDTRVLGWKAAATGASLQTLNAMIGLAQRYIDKAPDAEDASEMQDILDDLKELVSDADDAADQAEDADDGKALRRRADTMALEIASGGANHRKARPPEPEPEPEPKPEPPDAEALGRKVARLERQTDDEARRALRHRADEIARKAPVIELEPAPEPKPEPPKPPDVAEQRRKASRLEREENDRRIPDAPELPAEYATLNITHEEMAGLADGELKAVWSAAFINNLPDSAFLYIESGGDRDADGKTTPRSLRHFPYKDSGGAVDLPHLRNALARIPQSNLPSSVKERLTAKAQKLLDATKAVDETDKELKARSVDPLREQADALALEHASGGESLRKSPRPQKVAPPVFRYSVTDLKRRMREEMLTALSGIEEP